jgi:alpha/beta superfamily hydrolase
VTAHAPASSGVYLDPEERITPLYFGSADLPLFATFHPPAGRWSGTRVVLCAPLGYEGPFAHLALRELAHSLASGGAAVLRFDYAGYGDSAGSDETSDQVVHWIDSVNDAIDEVKRLAPSHGPVVLIGLRAGALLAAAAASSRYDVTALGLWAPCLSGKLFMREQRAFSRMAHLSAASREMPEAQWGATGFEANGYVFTDDTVAGLSKLDVRSMQLPSVTNVLLLDRDEAPVRNALPNAWRGSGVSLQEESIAGYAEFMEPPWIATHPERAIQTIDAWTRRLSTAVAPPVSAKGSTVSTNAIVESEFVETPVWLDPAHRHFGILTEPVDRNSGHVMLLITSTFGHRIGPNRMNVAAARHFASLGVATLRFDLSETGDSRAEEFAPAKSPYDVSAVVDVERAYDFLKSRGYQNVAIGGICAGAFLAWYAGRAIQGVSQLLLVNPQCFRPIRYELRDHQEYLQKPVPWQELWQRERNPLRLARALAARAWTAGRVGLEHIAARLPSVLFPSGLAAQLGKIGARGAKLSVIFSSDDPGIKEMHRMLGPHLRRYQEQGYLDTAYIEGADHSFTPRWAVNALVDQMASVVSLWSNMPSTTR